MVSRNFSKLLKRHGKSTKSKLFLLSLVSHLYLTSNTDRDYVPELEKARAKREKSLQAVKDDSMNRLLKDLSVDRAKNPASALNDRWDSEEEDDDGDIIDRCKSDNLFFSRCSPHTVSGRKKARRLCRCYSRSSSWNGGHKLAKARIRFMMFKCLDSYT